MHMRVCGNRGNCTGTPVTVFDTDTSLFTASCAVCRKAYKPGATRSEALDHWNEQVSEPVPAVPASTKRKRA